jgi:hypothetical protein
MPARFDEAICMEIRANKKFGRYEILAELGRGAMGVVYKAHDPQIGRVVALKTILLRGQEPEEEEEFRKRFLCEAQAAGRLQHPGIVAIYDAGQDEENQDPFIVLEFVGGESLNRILSREKKFSLPRALQLAEEIAEALDYAHAQGVVHRDIKPANILVSEDGHAKIADFGIAQLNLAHFTLPGRVLGTPAYMAPEQLSGEGADGRSDLFSVGVILYAMVTGHSPFQGNSATTVCFKVVNRDPMPASALDMDLPPALDTVISRAMAKDPAQRYQRGSELAQDLRRVRTGFPTGSNLSSHQPALSATGSARRTPAGPTPEAAAGMLRMGHLLRALVDKKPLNYAVGGAALLVALTLSGIPIRRAVVSQKAAAAQIAAAQKSTATQPAVAAVAKPRDSIIAEMEVAPSTAVDASVPATPVHTSSSLKVTAKHASGKTRAVASVSLPPAIVPAAKPVPVPTSTLELAIDHQFKEATLFVWVDDQLALTQPLHGGSQKRLVVFKGVHGIDAESLQVPAGIHQLRLRTQSADRTIDLSKTISADFVAGDDKTLQVTFDKHNAAMQLNWKVTPAR